MATVVLFDEIPDMVQRMHEETRARLADALDIPPEMLPTYKECAGAQAAHDESVSKLTVATLGIMIEQYRERYRLREDAPLTVSLGREAVEILERRGRLLGGGKGERRYVMVGEIKVEVQEDNWGRDFIDGFARGVGEGAKRQAPHTGPRRNAFTKRGKR